MKHFKSFVWVFVLMCFYACIEPFDFTVDTTETVLVVEGGITNLAQAHEIRLSYSYALDAEAPDVLSDAQVTIVSESGATETLTSQGDGSYVTSSNFAGQVGQSYKLVIVADETSYESSFEELLEGPVIDSVYGRYVQQPNEVTNQVEGGIQFFLDTQDQSLASSYYRYEWEDVYQIKVPYPSYFDVEVVGGVDDLILREEELGTCYAYDTSSSLIIGTAINSFENQLQELPLRHISEFSQKLRTRMTMLTRQYAVSENAYIYYRKLRENQDASGSLFDIQAGTVTGNISSSDPDEIVLGFFEVAGVSERRDYFEPNLFYDEGYLPPDFLYTCAQDVVLDIPTASAMVLDNDPFFQIGSLLIPLDPTSEVMAYVHHRTCSSCDWYADSTPPDFWIE